MSIKSPTDERIQEVLQRADALKRVEPDDLREGEKAKEGLKMFGNNFYYLFIGLRAKMLGIADEVRGPDYIEKAEALGEPWENFLAQNAQLIAQLNVVLADEKIYSDVFAIFLDFINTSNVAAAIAFNNRIHPRLGVNTIGIAIKRELNPLLEQAAQAMREAGIEPEDFYK